MNRLECSGLTPMEYSMLSIGACVVGKEGSGDYAFYVEIQPISDNYVKQALDV